ncbi:hypothetical protein CLIB1444_07S05248 [[Candida] jaroonii]|uniref:Uncharacterized protein n=1 Tax=[Candida] jaroonii TaxID=467808 RepID=A0ACA9YA26_9ASCO|nr:hypothetical protein CLIB1444_07S05248 [[Candida] jaroonii]
MSSIIRRPIILGLLSGLAVPPLATKFFLQPYIIDSKYNEIDALKYDLDTIGWHVRNLEEFKGVKEEDIYVPVSYFQGRY